MIGIIATVLITPSVLKPEMKLPGQIMLYIMVATIGYAASRKLGQWISEGFKKLILGDKRPGKGA